MGANRKTGRRVVGACLLIVATAFGAGVARADVVKDLLGFNPFARGADQPGTLPNYVDDGDEIVCPRVDVFEGGSSVRKFAGSADDAGSLAYQLTIGETSRECAKGPGDSVVIRLGVELRALLGPAGKPGTFSSPLVVQIRRKDSAVVRRVRNVAIAIPAGSAQGSATILEEGLTAPPGKGDVVIEVGLGTAGGAAPAKTRSSSTR